MPEAGAQTQDLLYLEGRLGGAVLSRDRLRRYRLTRRWGAGGLRIGVGMLNPSRADHECGDTTVTKVIQFASLLGGTSLVVVNLFTLRSKDPADLLRVADPVGPLNDVFLREAARDADRFVVAWGGMPSKLRGAAGPMMAALVEAAPRLECLGVTMSGDPRHPSRLGYNDGLRSLRIWRAEA